MVTSAWVATGWYLPCLRISDWLLLFREAGAVAVAASRPGCVSLFTAEIPPPAAAASGLRVVAHRPGSPASQPGWQPARPGCLGVN